MPGPQIGPGPRRRRRSAGGVATDPGVTAIRADGWSVDFTSPPTMQPATAPRYVALTRQGFTAAGAATSYSEALILTQRVRQPYPNQASLDPSRVAMSDYVYSTDTVQGGATNGSTEVSPKPIAAWARPDRALIGNTLRLEVVAAHRNARNREQVACVVFTVTDGTNSVTATVSQSSVLGHPNDLNPIIGYAADIDVSSLADGQIMANAKVYPWVGALASVHDSSVNAAPSRSFCPQIYYKNVARLAAPPLAYVSPSGVDATVLASGATAGGIQKVSTVAATAAANPFATIASAMSALKAATSITGGACDGCEVRLMAGSSATGAPAILTYVTVGELIITRDPNTTKAAAILNLAATVATRCPYIRMKGITIARTSTSQINMGQNSALTFEDTEITGTSTAQLHSGGAAGSPAVLRVIGHVSPAAIFGNVAAQDCRLLRGISGAGGGNMDPFCVIGCAVTNSGVSTSTAFGDVNNFVGFNRFLNWTGTNPVVVGRSDAGAPTLDGYAIIQNVIEWSGAQPQPGFRVSGDGGTPSTHHLVAHHNTFTGSGGYGRANILYVDTVATGARTHRLMSFKGNIHAQINTKHDVFAATSGNVGGWSYMYGVGCAGELTQFADSASAQNGTGGSFSQAYAGLGAKCGTSQTVALDPLFLAPASCFWNGSAVVAGAGNGDYRLQAGSPAAGMLAAPVLRFDLAGAVRPAAPNAAGAYSL